MYEQMKNLIFSKLLIVIFCFACLFTIISCSSRKENTWIRINQIGYLPNSIKVAVILSKDEINLKTCFVCRESDRKIVLTIENKHVTGFGEFGSFKSSYRLDFSSLQDTGYYYIQAGKTRSKPFSISQDVYTGTADYLLKYMRQQRCGYNPYYHDSCHTHDGFIVFHPNPKLDSTMIDVTGGWHDASDYLQYVTTSANAVHQMLFAYEQNSGAFSDRFSGNGEEGINQLPDILDEAFWGLDWLLKMNPAKGEMYNQIADDRDHRGFRLPVNDTVTYRKGPGRPVYFCTGEPQGSEQYKNKSTGVASTAGKFASAFALGGLLMKDKNPAKAEMLKQKAVEAYLYGKQNPGVCQTAPCSAPYYYEEGNWMDDMELAAIQLYRLTDDENYLNDAVKYGREEQVTPWMGADTARHYQWYPFVNLGHYYLASVSDTTIRQEFTRYLRKGIQNVYDRGMNNPFLNGVPFIWCSNNLVAGILTQCCLYEQLTGEKKFREMEAVLRDWLFGCNPWGTSMIIGFPENSDYPEDTHAALLYIKGEQPLGGLVDGPVYYSIYNNLKGIYLSEKDEYEKFQSDFAVYHDDHADYSTNEPTMDGTASLTYYLSQLEK